MRLLAVGLPNSIHTARWASALSGSGWEIHLLPVTDLPWHPALRDVALHALHESQVPPPHPSTRVVDRTERTAPLAHLGDAGRARVLADVVAELEPAVLHSHQLTMSGRIVLAAGDHLEGPLPPWVVSNWGSDIQLFGRDADHRDVIRSVLASCDAYWSECHRDVGLAWREGFRGRVLPVLPIGGGVDVAAARRSRVPGPRSQRRAIAVKGYEHALGRALLALDALDRCGDLLAGREVVLYAVSSEEVERAALRLERHGATVTVLRGATDDEILAAHGRSRVSIGLSVADGTSTSFLEALAGGSFPIQSRSACADEWIVDGETGLLVDAEDLIGLVRAVRRALTDDALVDGATRRNDAVVDAQLDRREIHREIVAAYESIRRLAPAATGAA